MFSSSVKVSHIARLTFLNPVPSQTSFRLFRPSTYQPMPTNLPPSTFKKNPWILATLVILAFISIFFLLKGKAPETPMTGQKTQSMENTNAAPPPDESQPAQAIALPDGKLVPLSAADVEAADVTKNQAEMMPMNSESLEPDENVAAVIALADGVVPLSSIPDLPSLLANHSASIPDLEIVEVENCAQGCCALRALGKSNYPQTPIEFPLLKEGSGYLCAYCNESVDRLKTPMIALINKTPIVFCSTGCYSYLLSAPVPILKKYRELHGFASAVVSKLQDSN